MATPLPPQRLFTPELMPPAVIFSDFRHASKISHMLFFDIYAAISPPSIFAFAAAFRCISPLLPLHDAFDTLPHYALSPDIRFFAITLLSALCQPPLAAAIAAIALRYCFRH